MAEAKRRKITIRTLQKMMREGDQITQLAVYDFRNAVIADRLGIDILCVSDTGGMILFGHPSTVSVTFDEVMSMAQAIDRGTQYGLRMVDMPYWSFHISPEQAVENAGRFVAEANAEVMKCEGNRHHARNIEAIIQAGIPVQGHIGITPMRVPQLGGFFAQGKTTDRAKELIDDAWAFVDAGCFSILCEVTTEEVCQYLTEILPVPVISLGAGNKAHGVHIIGSDLFHLYEEHVPRHSKIYTDLIPIIEDVYIRYMDDVRKHVYPGPEHTVYMPDDERAKFIRASKWKPIQGLGPKGKAGLKPQGTGAKKAAPKKKAAKRKPAKKRGTKKKR